MNYWNKRYLSGETSGKGSVDKHAKAKWQIIMKQLPNFDNYSSVLDYGCGDMSFWHTKVLPPKYIGIDQSHAIINRHKKQLPDLNFYHSSEQVNILSPDITFCFDVLFHITDDKEYHNVINKLESFNSDYIFITTWDRNPFLYLSHLKYLFRKRKIRKIIKWFMRTLNTDSVYQKYRKFNNNTLVGYDLIHSEYIIDRTNIMYIYIRTGET